MEIKITSSSYNPTSKVVDLDRLFYKSYYSLMKRATITDLKNKLSQYVRLVKEGETVVVLERGLPVADILPRLTSTNGAHDQLNLLETRGLIRRGKHPKGKFHYPKNSRSLGLLKTLLDERRSGR